MADSFTSGQIAGHFGEFKAVLDSAVNASSGNVQGQFGEFGVVLDEAATSPPAVAVDAQFVDFPASPGIAVRHEVVST